MHIIIPTIIIIIIQMKNRLSVIFKTSGLDKLSGEWRSTLRYSKFRFA